jgi:hypothetical protein
MKYVPNWIWPKKVSANPPGNKRVARAAHWLVATLALLTLLGGFVAVGLTYKNHIDAQANIAAWHKKYDPPPGFEIVRGEDGEGSQEPYDYPVEPIFIVFGALAAFGLLITGRLIRYVVGGE